MESSKHTDRLIAAAANKFKFCEGKKDLVLGEPILDIPREILLAEPYNSGKKKAVRSVGHREAPGEEGVEVGGVDGSGEGVRDMEGVNGEGGRG